MYWKDEAIAKLQRYKFMQQAICSIPNELKQLELAYERVRTTSLGEVSASGNGQYTQEDKMMNNILLREELEQSLERARLWVETVDNSLSLLDPVSRQVLMDLYSLDPPKLPRQLCKELGMEISTLYRRRNTALTQFTLGIYGFLES